MDPPERLEDPVKLPGFEMRGVEDELSRMTDLGAPITAN
jgi:hypothetical protein